jgi:ABC-type polysaccharide transport system permease subunit
MNVTGQSNQVKVAPYMGRAALFRLRTQHTLTHMRRRWQLYALLLIPILYMVIFHYVPMVGAQIAFRDYTVRDGIWGSEWVGLENFQRFFDSYLFQRLIVNTVTLGLYSLIAGFPIPIILALSLNQVRNFFQEDGADGDICALFYLHRGAGRPAAPIL